MRCRLEELVREERCGIMLITIAFQRSSAVDDEPFAGAKGTCDRSSRKGANVTKARVRWARSFSSLLNGVLDQLVALALESHRLFGN